ncbi:Equilibrative nucleoside transporter 3 [Trichoplax sp. H2]|nr:Equilibrative nucleoside transporter 3 [Trichoplax sp. H2]|eukprot:RDD43107.1 Equilibrative nucleoside transporter 3 [Trichoplax sp. H2]
MLVKATEDKPVDRYYLVYITFVILGIVSAMPIRIFISAASYYAVKLKGTPYQYAVENYIILAYSLPCPLGSTINIFLLRSINVRKRMTFSTIILIISFIITAILAELDTSKWKGTFIILTIATVAFSSLFGTTVYLSSLHGLSSIFPKEYSQAVQIGQAVCGVFTAAVNVLSIIVWHSVRHSGVGYFCSGIIILLLALIIQLLLKKNAFARSYMEKNLEYDVQQKMKQDRDDDQFCSESDEEFDHIEYDKSTIKRVMYITRKIWPILLALFLCYIVTHMVYPSITTRVFSIHKESHGPLTGRLFIPVACFLVYAIADLVGRIISGWILMPNYNQGLSLLFLAACRFILVPLFIYCNVQPRKHLSVKIHSDVVYIILILVLGLSQGYVKTLTTMYAPKLVHSRFKEATGAMVYFCITIAYIVSSLMAFGVSAIP